MELPDLVDEAPADPAASQAPQPAALYFIDTYLRQQGDYASILAIDAVLLQTDISADEQQRELQSIIQGVFRGKQT